MASLNTYSGTWSKKQLIHLLKRTMFGAKPSDIQYFESKNLSDTIAELLTLPAAPSPPINFYEGKDDGTGTPIVDPDGVAKGSTWINGTYGNGTVNFWRSIGLQFWCIGNQINQNRSIQEKMVLFWHYLLVTQTSSGIGATATYRLYDLFRKYSFTPLKTLLLEVSKNPAMLFYLNGYLNTKYSPDENYARELQELFSVGKGPGSQYTEDDVRQAAKVLTGHSIDYVKQTYIFYDTLHDTGNKTFSNFYNGKVITGKSGAAGADELTDLIDMLLATNECAAFICRKLYRFFVAADITTEIETDIIAPLAAVYRNNNYDLKPVLSKLLSSEHFYSTVVMGAQIKSPLDLFIGACREFNIKIPSISNIDATYKLWQDIYYSTAVMQQTMGDPPNVAGWPAYYQSPLYYELWVTSDTLPKRANYPSYLVYGGYDGAFDPIEFVKQFKNPDDPNKLLAQILETFYIYDISAGTVAGIKTSILLTGQASDSYWTSAWQDYIANPTDAAKKSVVENRIKSLVYYLVQSPHYQMC